MTSLALELVNQTSQLRPTLSKLQLKPFATPRTTVTPQRLDSQSFVRLWRRRPFVTQDSSSRPRRCSSRTAASTPSRTPLQRSLTQAMRSLCPGRIGRPTQKLQRCVEQSRLSSLLMSQRASRSPLNNSNRCGRQRPRCSSLCRRPTRPERCITATRLRPLAAGQPNTTSGSCVTKSTNTSSTAMPVTTRFPLSFQRLLTVGSSSTVWPRPMP